MSTFRFLGWVGLALMLSAGQLVVAQANGRDNDELIKRYMISVPTELITKVSSKNAAPGQPVAVRTKQAAQLANGTSLPQGAVLVGHVVAVQPKTDEHDYAMLSVIFDHAELKGSPAIPLRTSIQKLSEPTVNSGTNILPPIASSGQLGAGGIGGVPQSTPGIGTGRRRTAESPAADPTTGLPALPEPGPSPGTPTAAGGETVGTRPQATGLPGVMLSNNSSAELSGTLTEFGRNIDLPSGTEIRLGVIGR